jgi:hypothetical protein
MEFCDPPTRESATAAGRELLLAIEKCLFSTSGDRNPCTCIDLIAAHTSAACARAVGEAVAGKDKRIARLETICREQELTASQFVTENQKLRGRNRL